MRALPRLPVLGLLALGAALPAFAPAVFVAPALAATLKPFGHLAEPVVRLSDLFDGVEADRVIGPAPQPGGRITVEAPQLAAIARQFGVDWRPASPADRAVLERRGRPLPREEAMEALRAALAGAGAGSDAEPELAAYAPPMVPAEGAARPAVGQLDYDAKTGRFTAVLMVSAEGMAPVQARLSGRVQEMVDLPVPRRRLLPGDVITAADLQMLRMRVTATRGELVQLAQQAVGQGVRRPVAPGQPIPLADLGRPALVHKGGAVRVVLDGPGIALSAQGIAAEPGGLGERVRVFNPVSRAVLEAEVIGPDQVRVLPGTAPLAPPARPGQALPQVAAR